MRSWGIWLVILGILAFVYPMFGYELKILSFFDDDSYYVAAVVLMVAGVILLILSFVFQKKNALTTTPGAGEQASDPLSNSDKSGTGTN
jgi:amino acid transporter